MLNKKKNSGKAKQFFKLEQNNGSVSQEKPEEFWLQMLDWMLLQLSAAMWLVCYTEDMFLKPIVEVKMNFGEGKCCLFQG